MNHTLFSDTSEYTRGLLSLSLKDPSKDPNNKMFLNLTRDVRILANDPKIEVSVRDNEIRHFKYSIRNSNYSNSLSPASINIGYTGFHHGVGIRNGSICHITYLIQLVLLGETLY